MVHAETCPVCHGIGRTEYAEGGSGTTVRKSQPCHGCAGKGWVEVGSDDPVAIPVIPWPVDPNPWHPAPYIPPRWPHVTWTYSHDRGL